MPSIAKKMGVSKDIRTESEKWLETTKIEIMAKLDSVCKDLETRLLRAYNKLEEKVKVLEGEKGKGGKSSQLM